MSKSDDIKRKLGVTGMPTGHFKMADLRNMTVRRVEPVEEEPSTVPSIFDMNGLQKNLEAHAKLAGEVRKWMLTKPYVNQADFHTAVPDFPDFQQMQEDINRRLRERLMSLPLAPVKKPVDIMSVTRKMCG
jgi:hypothetical protein